MSLELEHSLTCTYSFSDFNVTFKESLTGTDFSHFLSYNMTHLRLYGTDYKLLGSFDIIMTLKDYFG